MPGNGEESGTLLRAATAADAGAIARIWREGWADAHVGHVPDDLVEARTPASFDERARELVGGTVVAVRGGAVVGFVMVEGDQVDQLYLDRSARGAGVGALLLDEGERVVLAAGHPRAWLAVATGNQAAHRFYARQGWVDDGPLAHRAPVPGGTVVVDCHRFLSPPARAVPARGTRGRAKRADAVRNIEAIVEAAIRLLAVDPDTSVNDIARAAGVGRVTLYGHFDSRTALVREVVERAIHSSNEALDAVDLDGDPREALGRLLEATWHVTHRFGALVVAGTQALPPEELRRAHEEPAARVLSLLARGRDSGAFRDDMPIDWQVTVIQAVMHGASAAVHRGEISAEEAPALVRDTALGALTA